MKVTVKLMSNIIRIAKPVPKSKFLPLNNAGIDPIRIKIVSNAEIHGHKTNKSFLFIYFY